MEQKIRKLTTSKIYWDKVNQERVEFGYMGQTGLAIVYQPGNSGEGMQSSWAINPNNLEEIAQY